MYLKETRQQLGSVISVELIGMEEELLAFLLKSFWNEIEVFEKRFSRFRDDSEVGVLNNSVGERQEVSDLMWKLLVLTEGLKRKTGGAFDIAIGDILEGWGYNKDYSFIAKEKLNKAGNVLLSENDRQVLITSKIDFGGIGKGYILDLSKKIFESVKHVCVNAGGDIYVKGKNQEGQRWKIFFENPVDISQVIGFVEKDEGFFACSSPSKRKWGKFHHLVNAELGTAADQMLATYTQAKSGVLVDAYSTALFVMGYEKAKHFLMDNQDIQAMLVGPNGSIFKTPLFEGELFVS